MAELKDRLRADLTGAMKAHQTQVMGTLRMALAAIGNEEVAGASARQLTNDEEQAVVAREVRKRHESAEIYAGAGRSELADQETAEAAILSAYLPQPLTDQELDAIVTEEVAGLAEVSPKAMGQVIKAVNARAKGRADGAVVAAKVKTALGLG